MKTTVYPEPPQARQFGLDLIRALAIVFVVASHFAKTVELLGFWGVELFFGLSAYLIGHILWRNVSTSATWSAVQIVNFWARRWWRTLPSYYLFLGVSLGLAYMLNEFIPPLPVLARFLWFGQSFTGHDGGWFYTVSWSLCVEEWFYLLFPLVVLVATFFTSNTRLSFGLAILVIFVGSFVTRQFLVAHNPRLGEDLRMITLARLDAIACGVLVAYYVAIVAPGPKARWLLFLLGLVFIAGAVVIPRVLGMSVVDIKSNAHLLFVAPLGGSLLLPFVGNLPKPGGALAVFAIGVKKISLWSYSIYLSHLPIITVVYFLEDKYGPTGFRENLSGNLVTKAVCLLLIIGVSALLYTYFEHPLLQKRPGELHTVAMRPVVNQQV